MGPSDYDADYSSDGLKKLLASGDNAATPQIMASCGCNPQQVAATLAYMAAYAQANGLPLETVALLDLATVQLADACMTMVGRCKADILTTAIRSMGRIAGYVPAAPVVAAGVLYLLLRKK